jgi:uncharacterized protein (TIGR02996 family)
MCAERAALLAGIWESPGDDAPRLVFADWLQEHGDAERAAFIRSQIEAAGKARAGSHSAYTVLKLRAAGRRWWQSAVAQYQPWACGFGHNQTTRFPVVRVESSMGCAWVIWYRGFPVEWYGLNLWCLNTLARTLPLGEFAGVGQRGNGDWDADGRASSRRFFTSNPEPAFCWHPSFAAGPAYVHPYAGTPEQAHCGDRPLCVLPGLRFSACIPDGVARHTAAYGGPRDSPDSYLWYDDYSAARDDLDAAVGKYLKAAALRLLRDGRGGYPTEGTS